MARTISLSVPHDLSEEEVKRRLTSAITDARTRFSGQLNGLQETWTAPNKMEFSASAMGQTINGRVEIAPKALNLQVDLPMLLGMLANKFIPQFESETRKLLEKK